MRSTSFHKTTLFLMLIVGVHLFLAGGPVAHAQTFLELEEQILETEVERPEAMFMRTPLPLAYEPRPLRSSFMEELFRTVEDNPSL